MNSPFVRPRAAAFRRAAWIAEPALSEQIRQVRANPPPKGGIKVVLRIPPEGWEEASFAQ